MGESKISALTKSVFFRLTVYMEQAGNSACLDLGIKNRDHSKARKKIIAYKQSLSSYWASRDEIALSEHSSIEFA